MLQRQLNKYILPLVELNNILDKVSQILSGDDFENKVKRAESLKDSKNDMVVPRKNFELFLKMPLLILGQRKQQINQKKPNQSGRD
jgi:hypothetical protein